MDTRVATPDSTAAAATAVAAAAAVSLLRTDSHIQTLIYGYYIA
jgi:hypothetical protein